MADHILQIVYPCLPESPFPALDPDFHKPSSSSDRAAGGEDRISALPDDLLRNIVSRLRVKDAGRAAAISPRWRDIWRSTPCNLEDRHLLRQLDLEDCIDWSVLAAAVSRVLVAHPGPFRWVHLTWNFMGSKEEALAKWLRLFAAKGVETLVLVNRPWPLDVPLPASILHCSALRRLYIGVWHFPDTSRLTVPPRGPDVFPHLQELGICHTIMDERDLQYLLACSPELKILGFIVSYGFPSLLEISSRSLCCMLLWFSMADELAVVDTPRLQRLIIYSAGTGQTLKVKIGHAPQLTVLGYLDTATHVLEIGNTIITAGVTNVSPNALVPSVKVLALKVNFGVTKEVKTMLRFLRCFPHVETLHVMMICEGGGGDNSDDSDQENEEENNDDNSDEENEEENNDDNSDEENHHDNSDGSDEENEEENHDDNTAAAEASAEISKFWQEVDPIECVEAHVKKVVLFGFSAGANELEFLKLVLERGLMMQNVVVVLAGWKNTATAAATLGKLQSLASTAKLAAELCALEILGRPRGAWTYRRASDLSVSDPFPG